MIEIKKSHTADSRTCDRSTVTKQQLLESSLQHINDVSKGLAFFVSKLVEAAGSHDYDKISDIDWFLEDFKGTICKPDGWLANHYKIHRHHLAAPNWHPDKELGVPKDVNLLDVLEMVSDCVMAGKGRSGQMYPLVLPNELLQLALRNTVELLSSNVSVCDA